MVELIFLIIFFHLNYSILIFYSIEREMSPMDEHVVDLRSTGLRVTTARVSILEVFENSSRRHLTADDVFKALLNKSMDIGLATVYRVLTQFEHAGILIRSNFESGKAIYELNEGHHDHLIDVKSGEIIEFVDEEIEKLQKKVAEKYGYTLVDHKLELYGVKKKS